ncbi:MAG TPA: VOC family protein [Flavisolibacter sp.]|jgi:lactoylglutathione lyase|nr:VOC family protein [Flavisolibacter sp.]
MTPFLGLRTAIYKVADVTKAKEWYTRAFATEPYFDEPFYVGYNIGGFELGLQPGETVAPQKAESVAAYWGVEDVAAVYESLLQAGALPHEPPQNVGGDIIVATVKDPWDNVIGLIYNPHFNAAK